jgi:hypothetical protein
MYRRSGLRLFRRCLFFLLAFLLSSGSWVRAAEAQENPYFVTYDHYLEEPGNLEVEYFSTFGTQRGGNNFHSYWTEFEYGATAWWTTEFYLNAQTTFDDSTVYSGFKWENRFRPLQHEHWINPILYVEYEDINGTDKTLKEIVGHDVEADFLEPNAETRREHLRELELKLILSSTVKGWNISENIISEKNLSNEPWEFGYALAVSRPLSLKGSPTRCSFCRQNFVAGVEMYGGLGDRYSFGLKDTAHYLAPAVAWNMPSGWTLRLSPGFGLNDNSHKLLLRWGVSREISGFAGMVRRLFGAKS